LIARNLAAELFSSNRGVSYWHPLASSKAFVVLHPVMRPALHCHIHMVVEIVINLPAFLSR
jgi:hypothetical protein